MPTSTSRLVLTNPVGVDPPSELRVAITNNMGILDNAAVYREGTLGGRPAPASLAHGTLYRTTDTGAETFSWSDGSLWLPLGLVPSLQSTNIGAVSGQAIITTGGSALTVTLPAHAAGQTVAVVNQTTRTTTVSGSNIQGIGLSSASSVTLPMTGQHVVLVDDGTNWNIVGGGPAPPQFNYRVAGSSLTANPWDFVEANAGTTISLPAPTLNTMVGVQAGSAVTGTSPVTILSGGSDVFGIGQTGGESGTVLGTPFASVLLQGDGTNWIIIDGQQDSGWVPVSLTSGITQLGSAYTAAYRLQGDVVQLRGAVQNTSGSTIASGTTLLTAAGGAPTHAVALPTSIVAVPSAVVVAGISVSGNLSITANLANNAVVQLDGMNYQAS